MRDGRGFRHLDLTRLDKMLKEEIGSVIEKDTKGSELKRAMHVSKEAHEVQQAVEPVIFLIWDPTFSAILLLF